MDCVRVCPVDCFHEGENFLVIDPDICIDCTVCVAECPVDAIFPYDEIPESQIDFIEINKIYSKLWPMIVEKGEVPADSDDWRLIDNKKMFLKS
jgi:ferredoxin